MCSHTSPFIRETREEKWVDGARWGVAEDRQRGSSVEHAAWKTGEREKENEKNEGASG